MYQLFYEETIAPEMDPVYIPVNFISNMDEFRNAENILFSLLKNTDRIKYVEYTYDEYKQFKESVQKPTKTDWINLERKTRSFFLEFNVFLEHWKKRIDQHTRKDEFAELFIQKTHQAYDNSKEYALSTIIRNYIVHNAGIIQGMIWGACKLDVGFYICELIKDEGMTKNKKDFLKSLPEQYYFLNPIMAGTLDKLQEIQKDLVAFTIDDKTQDALNIISEGIKNIKEYNDTNWFFADVDEKELTTAKDKDGKPIQYIQGKLLEEFMWKEYDELITTIQAGIYE